MLLESECITLYNCALSKHGLRRTATPACLNLRDVVWRLHHARRCGLRQRMGGMWVQRDGQRLGRRIVWCWIGRGSRRVWLVLMGKDTLLGLAEEIGTGVM